MPFKSAELKREYARAHAEGVLITASQAGHLFHYGLLADAVENGIDIKLSRDQALGLVLTKTRALKEDQDRLAKTQHKLKEANDWVAYWKHEYSVYAQAATNLSIYSSKLNRLKKQEAQLQARLKWYDDKIAEDKKTLRDAIADATRAGDRVSSLWFAMDTAKDLMKKAKERFDWCEWHSGGDPAECMNEMNAYQTAIKIYKEQKQLYEQACLDNTDAAQKVNRAQNNLNIDENERREIVWQLDDVEQQIMDLVGALEDRKTIIAKRDQAADRLNYWTGQVIDLQHKVDLLETLVHEDEVALKHAKANWAIANRKWKQWWKTMRSHTG